MGFLYFVLKCIHVLAWPSFALGYPLCASVRAIETNSNHRMRKLITYWILFSLISLFEIAFVKLIQWVPIWPYIKLVVICSLVLPRFKGAYYAYKTFVHPCLTVNLEEVINKLSKPQEPTLKAENFLAVAEKYVKENGTEALEKLIASKGSRPNADVEEIKAIPNAEENVLAPAMQSKCKDPNFAHKDVKVAESSKKNTASALNWVTSPDVKIVQTEKKAIAAVENKETTMPSAGGEKALRLEAPLQKVQKEWTCAMCQVRTSSETILNDHLQGNKHEELIKLTTKNKVSSSSTADKSVQVNYDLKTSVSGAGVIVYEGKTKKQEKNIQVKVNGEQCKQSLLGGGVNQNKTNKNKEEKTQVKEMNNYKNWCALCNVLCNSEADLKSHLSGKKHLSRVQEPNASSWGWESRVQEPTTSSLGWQEPIASSSRWESRVQEPTASSGGWESRVQEPTTSSWGWQEPIASSWRWESRVQEPTASSGGWESRVQEPTASSWGWQEPTASSWRWESRVQEPTASSWGWQSRVQEPTSSFWGWE